MDRCSSHFGFVCMCFWFYSMDHSCNLSFSRINLTLLCRYSKKDVVFWALINSQMCSTQRLKKVITSKHVPKGRSWGGFVFMTCSKVLPNNFSFSFTFFPLGILDSKKIHCRPFFFPIIKTHFDNGQLLNRMIFTLLHMNHSCELYISIKMYINII